MSIEGTNGNPAPQIPQSIMGLSAALEGLPGANQILADTGKEAVDSGIITFADAPKAPENVVTPPAPVVTNEQSDDEPEEKPAAKPIVDNTPDEDDEDLKDNPLAKMVKGKTNPKQEPTFDNFDQIKDAVKKDFGIDMKNEKDLNKVFSSSKKWREEAQKVPTLEKDLENLNSIFENMPAALLNATKAWADGKDNWENEITSRPKFDFTKSADKQDINQLVNHYFPNDFDKEDWTAETEPKALQIAKKSAIEKFNADKRELDKQSAEQIEKANLRLETRKNSISSSLNNLTNSLPDVDKNDLKGITKILESGDVNSLFFNRDGSYNIDAAKKLLMALHGEKAIKSLMKVSANRAETRTNEDILTRGADKPNPQKGGRVNSDSDVKTQQAIDALVGGLNKTRTY